VGDSSGSGQRRHIAAEAHQEGQRHAAVQAELVEAAIDDEGNAMHDAGLFEQHQQYHQRDHVGNDNAEQTDAAIEHGTAKHASEIGRLPGFGPGDQARDCEAVKEGADLEDEKQHDGEDRQRAGEAPAWVQKDLVGPALPAWLLGTAAGASDRFVQHGGAMVAVGVDFLAERARQDVAGGIAGIEQLDRLGRKMAAQFLEEVVVVLGQLQGKESGGHVKGIGHRGLRDDVGNRREMFDDMRTGRLWLRRALLVRRADDGAEQVGQTDAHVCHGRHHRGAEFVRQRPHVDEQPLAARLVHAVEGDHQRLADLRKFQRQFEITLQRRGIHHQ